MLEPGVCCVEVGQVAVETRPGRSLKIESPFRSVAVVTLMGEPELAIRNGLKRKPYFMAMEPPKNRRWRISNVDRP